MTLSMKLNIRDLKERERDRAKQINESAYIITETEETDMTITCPQFKTKVPIKGTVILEIKPGCVASTNNLVINHPKIVAEVTVKSKLILLLISKNHLDTSSR